jgi:hypothetical protein
MQEYVLLDASPLGLWHHSRGNWAVWERHRRTVGVQTCGLAYRRGRSRYRYRFHRGNGIWSVYARTISH